MLPSTPCLTRCSLCSLQYNAPVALYIVYQYPEAAPLVYVRPVTGILSQYMDCVVHSLLC